MAMPWNFCSVDSGGATTVMMSLTTVILVMPLGILGVILLRLIYLRHRYSEKKPPKPLNLMQSFCTRNDPERSEELLVVLSCYKETLQELQHSISTLEDLPPDSPSVRLMIFLDGLQGKAAGILEHMSNSTSTSDIVSEDDVSSTLRALLTALHVSASSMTSEAVHGSWRIQGVTGGVPFELYIKDSFARSKRASQALCLSILKADFERSKAQPQAMLFLDGDCRVEPTHLKDMFDYLITENLAACGCFLLTEKVSNFCLLVQLVRDWASQRLQWLAQSFFRFQCPLNGSCAMFSMEALRQVQVEFCRGLSQESMLDSMRIEMGEDSFMTNLLHETCSTSSSSPSGIAYLPHVHATSFMPETWSDYLAQQCRWKRSHLGNRTALLFWTPKAWTWHTWPLWFLYVLCFFWSPHFAPATMTLWLSVSLGSTQLGLCRWFPGAIAPVLHLTLWVIIVFYALASTGSVHSKGRLHMLGTCFFMFLGLLQMALLAMSDPLFFVAPLFMSLSLLLLQLPTGRNLRRPEAILGIYLMPLAAFIELIQHPTVAVSNADGLQAKWATRETEAETEADKDDTVEMDAMAIRVWSKWLLLTSWLYVNYAMGAILLAFDAGEMAVKISGFALMGYLMINMLLAVCQTIWTFSTQPLKERETSFYGESPRYLPLELNFDIKDDNSNKSTPLTSKTASTTTSTTLAATIP